MVIRTFIKLLLILFLSIGSAFLVFESMQPKSNLLFENSDFEKGNLKNWIAEGPAFESQPTLDDNPVKRGLTQPTGFQGHYWLGTYEKRPSTGSPEGTIQSDVPTGKLTSRPFIIKKNKISFLDGAGTGAPDTVISLIVNGQTVLTHSPNGFIKTNETMSNVTWDTSAWVKQKATIVIVDQASGAWGHINADYFHYE